MSNLAKRGRGAQEQQPREVRLGQGRRPRQGILYCISVYVKAVVTNSARLVLACLALQQFKHPASSLARQNHSPICFDWGPSGVHPCAVRAEFARIRTE